MKGAFVTMIYYILYTCSESQFWELGPAYIVGARAFPTCFEDPPFSLMATTEQLL